MPHSAIRFLARSAPLCVLVLGACTSAGSSGGAVAMSEASRMRTLPAALPSRDTAAVALGTRSSGDTIEFSVLIAGRSAGRLRQWPDTSGTVTTTYRYNDRGLGPALTQTRKFDKAGIPIAMQLSGTDHLQGAVREMIQPGPGALVTWRNDNAAGRVTPGSGFYLPLATMPSDVAALARALVLSRTKTVPLLPDGVARLAIGTARTVTGAGGSLRITPHEVDGLGLTPAIVWLDGAQQLFASGDHRQMVVRRGFESSVPTLVQAQGAASLTRSVPLARRLSRRPRGPVAFVHVNLFDATAKKMVRSQTVIVRGDRVVASGPDGAVVIPRDAEVINGTGKSLLPGLWDMHVQVQDDDGLLHLAAGVTTVRDLATDVDELRDRRTRFDDGTLLGPRVLVAGAIDGPGPFAGPTTVLISTRDAAKAAVNAYADRGYAQVTVNSSLDPQLVPTIVRTAHQRAMQVSGNVPFGMTAEQLVRGGADELQQANMLFIDFLTDSPIDTRTVARFTDVARLAGSIDVRSDRVVRFIQLLKERNVAVDPTLNRFEELFTFRSGTLNDATLPVAQRLPLMARRGLLSGGLSATPKLEPVYRASFVNMQRFVRRLHDAGVPILAGSDAATGFPLHRELELYSEANIPNLDILYLATLGAAKVMNQDAERGSLAVGRVADLVLVDGDPSQRMRDLRRMELVMKGGVIYLPDSLYAAVGVKPAPRKGVIPTREVRADDVTCRGAGAITRNGARTPLKCSVIDSGTSSARNRRPPAARPRRPAAPAKKKP